MDPLEIDYVTISGSPSSESCGYRINLVETLTYRHFGSTETDWSDHGGLDLRGEVSLLTRNVKVVGEDTETWGGQIVVVDFVESDGTERSGYVWMDSV